MTAAWIVQGDARRLPLRDRSVQCVVTSPPYFGLRSYGGLTSIWGGDPACTHNLEDGPARRPMTGGTGAASAKQVTNAGSQFGNAWVASPPSPVGVRGNKSGDLSTSSLTNGERQDRLPRQPAIPSAICTLCGAWAGELGSEPTPAAFVAHLVEVLAEVWRVLRPDGVVFCNIGDSYNGSKKGNTETRKNPRAVTSAFEKKLDPNSRPKSLLLVPERLAIALSDAGWIIRSRIAWCKAAPMPESVKDRPTSAWEHIWVITKQGRYYWDHEAVREQITAGSLARHGSGKTVRWADHMPVQAAPPGRFEADAIRHYNSGLGVNGPNRGGGVSGRNLWNYWVLPPDPYPGAHFATFPREIPRRCIAAASREGDLILDPFSGSGTVAYQAARMGRRGLGVELSAEYLEQTRATRLAQRFLPL